MRIPAHGMLRIALAALLLAPIGTALAAGGGGGGGGGGFSGASSGPQKSPEQMAAESYRQGARHNERGRRYEAEALEETSDRKRARLAKRATQRYERAIKSLRQALRYDNQHYEAMNELGYALRKTGEFESSVGVYNAALKIKPDYAPAMEYRAEALLALGLYDHVKSHYQWLVNNDADLAAQLMNAMQVWASAQDAPAEDAEAFAQWVEERAAMADAQASLLQGTGNVW